MKLHSRLPLFFKNINMKVDMDFFVVEIEIKDKGTHSTQSTHHTLSEVTDSY